MSSVDEYLKELETADLTYSTQLYSTVRQLLELYCDVVPTYHRRYLEMLPQVSG